MKKYIKLIMVSIMAMAVAACTPDSHELGEIDVTAEQLVNGVAFSVEQDAEDPNTIYLKNLMTGYTPLWEHPQGRSQANEVTLKIPFKGDYTVKFGVMTRGGYVYGEPYTFTLTTDNLAYVDDPLWNTLSGGPGNEKTWVLDINAEGVCKYFVGPLYFYGTDDTYDVVTNGNAAIDYNGDGAIDSWSWAADWAGNGSWLFSTTGAMDYGTMTFDLKDGAHVIVENLASGETFNGSYMLDVENYTLTLSDAELLHDPGRDAIVTKWGDCRVLSLTEDAMQLGVLRDNDPNEGPCLLVYNFISKEYADNWTPAAPSQPAEPELPEGWQQTVGQISQTAIKWTIDTNLPLDWFSPAGASLNGWTSGTEYPDWLGVLDASLYEGFSLTLDSADNSYTAVGVDGVETTGTFTLDEKGIYTFDNGLPTFALVGWATFAADADNQLRILAINTNKAGIISDMWVGAKALNEDGSIKEYLGYHLIANVGAGGGGVVEPEPAGYSTSIYFTNSGWWPSGNGEAITVTGDGSYTCSFSADGTATNDVMVFCVDMVGLRNDYPLASAKVTAIRADGVAIDFDPAKIAYGDLEDNGNLRIEIANTWGLTAGNYAIAESTSFSDTIEVDFEVSFEGAYKGQVMLTNDGWWPGYSGVDNVGMSGPGIYKFYADMTSAGAAISVPMIFCFDLLAYPDATTAVAGVRSIKATYQDETSAELTIKPENLSYGDLEEKGNLRWDFFNIYSPTGNGVTSAPYDYSLSVIDGAEFAAGVVGLEFVLTIE